MRDMILILSSNDKSGRELARKFRTERIYCKVVSEEASMAQIAAETPSGVVLSGETEANKELFSLGVPVLALGAAAKRACLLLGGEPEGDALHKIVMPVSYAATPIFAGVAPGERWIADALAFRMPDGYRAIADASGFPVAYLHEDARVHLLQLQIERNDPDGMRMLRNFAFDICACTPWWSVDNIIASAESELRAIVGEEGHAVCAMSGGLDSTVAALLAMRALGERAHPVFVDSGLFRQDEREWAARYFAEEAHLAVRFVDASSRVLSALTGVQDTEDKRRAVSREIRLTLLEEAEREGFADVLVRGRNYSDPDDDLSESDTGGFRAYADPLRELFKDEIRAVGAALGLTQEMLTRQPFPGAGLAERIVGRVNADRLETLRVADARFRSELSETGLDKRLTRYYACLDRQSGHDSIILRALQGSETSRTASRLPYDLLERVTETILRELPTVTQVLYDLSPDSD